MEDRVSLETKYSIATQVIKTAILQSQYRALKLVNQEQLALYYGIGRYISGNSRKGYWGQVPFPLLVVSYKRSCQV